MCWNAAVWFIVSFSGHPAGGVTLKKGNTPITTVDASQSKKLNFYKEKLEREIYIFSSNF